MKCHKALATVTLLLIATPNAAIAQAPAPAQDHRQFVQMPPAALAAMRADMLDHLAALNEILGLLAEDKLETAGDLAEARIGQSSMGKHAGALRGMGPGRFMPEGMRNIGWSMHDAASEFARSAKAGDRTKSLSALNRMTSSCVACHMAYRTR